MQVNTGMMTSRHRKNKISFTSGMFSPKKLSATPRGRGHSRASSGVMKALKGSF